MNKNNKGFTLIELIVVMAVIAILAILAVPKIIGNIENAKETRIKQMIEEVETAVDIEVVKNGQFPLNWNLTNKEYLNDFIPDKLLYDKNGIITSLDNNNYYRITKSFLEENCGISDNGVFYTDNNNKVYYLNIDSSYTEDGEKALQFDRDVDILSENSSKLEILNYQFPNGIFKYNETADGNINIKGIEAGDYVLEMKLVHCKASNEIITENVNFNISQNEIKNISFSHEFSQSRIGFYDFYLTIKQNDEIVAEYEVPKSIYFTSDEWEYFYQDDFVAIDSEIGRIGELKSDNVLLEYVYDDVSNIDYGRTTINIPANTNTSGQVHSVLPVTYNSYEAKIKVPNNDSLLNGFFLYKQSNVDSDITYEIDMEILYYEGKWQLWNTVFNPSNEDYDSQSAVEPGVIYQDKIDLSFDPSADYHTYRINFYDNYISFELDNTEVSKWNGSFDYSDMYVYTGDFYTHWLANNIATEDQQMNIEWIRRAFLK